MIQLKKFSIIKHRKYYYMISIGLIIIGLTIGFVRGFNFGIDFTGGTMIQINMEKEVSVEEITKITKQNDINADIVHSGEGNKEILIKTAQALDSAQRDKLYDDIFKAYSLDKTNILQYELFGPSIGDTLKSNSMKAVFLATLGILIYIAIRFEWKFGIAAVVALFHDVLFVIGFYGVLGLPINSPFIASMLIIFGYSVSDTVVIFDRIRENLKIHKKMKTEEIIDLSINQTLVRSLATSFTTILAIFTLYIVGVDSIKQFTLPLLVGIAVGAASSIFVASPVWYEITRLINAPRYQGK